MIKHATEMQSKGESNETVLRFLRQQNLAMAATKVPNYYYENNGDLTFSDRSAESTLNFPVSHLELPMVIWTMMVILILLSTILMMKPWSIAIMPLKEAIAIF